MSAIDFIAPQTKSLPVGELTFTIEPVRMAQVPGLLRAIEPALTELYFLVGQNSVEPDRLMGLCASFSGEMIEAVAIMARAERSVVDNLLPDQFMALAMVCVEVNRDFFTKALPRIWAQAPSLAPGVASALARVMPGKGAPASATPANPVAPATGPAPLTS